LHYCFALDLLRGQGKMLVVSPKMHLALHAGLV